MKVLIADDLQPKINNLVEMLVRDCKMARDDILVSQTATDARRILQKTKIDLFILDVVLPLRAEDAPTCETSLELLQEIAEEDLYIRPAYILGLTAYPEVLAQANSHFRDWLWTLIQFDQSSNNWAKPICNCIEYIRGIHEQKHVGYETDVCVLTALADPEMKAVQRLPWEWEAATPIDDATFVNRGAIIAKGNKFSVVSAVASRMGMALNGSIGVETYCTLQTKICCDDGSLCRDKGKNTTRGYYFCRSYLGLAKRKAGER